MTPRIRLLINGLLVLALVGAAGLAMLGWHESQTAAIWGRLLIGAGLGGAIAIVVMLFLPLELRANLTLLSAAILITLWVASWILHEPELSRDEELQRGFEESARDAGVPFDERSPIQVIRDLSEGGIDAAPVFSAWALFDEESESESEASDGETPAGGESALIPLAGRSRTTTVVCNEQGDYLLIDSDRYGYNNPDQAYAAKSPVLILGDSFAFGYCVRPGRDVGNQLRARDVDVVNLGYPGTGPLVQLAELREYGRLIHPSVIVWLYFQGNDRLDLTQEYDEPALRRYLDPNYHQSLPARQEEIDALWADYYAKRVLMPDRLRWRDQLGSVLLMQPLRDRLAGRISGIAGRRSRAARIERLEESLDAIITESEALDAKLYFVFLPAYGAFTEPHMNRLEERRDEVLAAVRARGLPLIDFQARMLETGDPLQFFPFRKPGHYTAAAYELLAEQILDQLRSGPSPSSLSAAPRHSAPFATGDAQASSPGR